MSQNDYHMQYDDEKVGTLHPTLGADEPSETQKSALKSRMERMRAEIAEEAAAVEAEKLAVDKRASSLDDREARIAAREAALNAASAAVPTVPSPKIDPSAARVDTKQKKE